MLCKLAVSLQKVIACRLLRVPAKFRGLFLRDGTFCCQLVEVIVQSSMFPADFTSWKDEDDVDEDEFERFRDQLCADLLCASFQLLGPRVLSIASSVLQVSDVLQVFVLQS